MDKQQKAKDLSFLLPFIGLLLFSPLILAIIFAKQSIFGLPSLPLFIFISWLILILCSYFLTKKLKSAPKIDVDDVTQSEDL